MTFTVYRSSVKRNYALVLMCVVINETSQKSPSKQATNKIFSTTKWVITITNQKIPNNFFFLLPKCFYTNKKLITLIARLKYKQNINKSPTKLIWADDERIEMLLEEKKKKEFVYISKWWCFYVAVLCVCFSLFCSFFVYYYFRLISISIFGMKTKNYYQLSVKNIKKLQKSLIWKRETMIHLYLGIISAVCI